MHDGSANIRADRQSDLIMSRTCIADDHYNSGIADDHYNSERSISTCVTVKRMAVYDTEYGTYEFHELCESTYVYEFHASYEDRQVQ